MYIIADLRGWLSTERQNIEKHNIDLGMVKKVFDDPFRIVQYDITHSGLEDRWQTLGMAAGVLFVVYTERSNHRFGEKIRIVTARKATPEERRIYYGKSEKGYWFIP